MTENNISTKLGLKISGHADIDFVDVNLNDDTPLFLDPCLIESGKTEESRIAHRTMSSFFDMYYQLYAQIGFDEAKCELLNNAHEINATKLGYGNGRNGHAKTSQGLLDTFRPIERLIQDGLALNRPCDLPIFLPHFAEDCMSDMITNILFNDLCRFTLAQCEKYHIPTYSILSKYFYWDIGGKLWTPYSGKFLIIDSEIILLVPKSFVMKRYHYNTAQILSVAILDRVQQERTTIGGNGKLIRPTKKDLKEELKGDSPSAEVVQRYIKKDPSFLSDYHNYLEKEYQKLQMSDAELDFIVYG